MDEKLTVTQVVEHVGGMKPATWRAYVTRGQAPPPDGQYDQRTPWWWRSTVDRWNAGRRRQR